MYVDLDIQSMLVLFERFADSNITETMIFSEFKKNNYDPQDFLHIIMSNMFLEKIDYDIDDEFKNLRKLIGIVKLRRKAQGSYIMIFAIRKIVSDLKYLKEEDPILFKLYYNTLKIQKNINHHSFNPPVNTTLEYIVEFVENFIETDKVDYIIAGESIVKVMYQYDITEDLAILLLYLITELDYYLNVLVTHYDNIDVINNTAINDSLEIIESKERLLKGSLTRIERKRIFNRRNTVSEEFMSILEDLISQCETDINKYKCNKKSYNNLCKLRDIITRFTIEKTL